MMRLIADLVMTTSLSATYSDSRSPWRHTCAASITRSSITSPPARKASSAGKSSSLVRAVRKPKPPRFTPSMGTLRSPTEPSHGEQRAVAAQHEQQVHLGRQVGLPRGRRLGVRAEPSRLLFEDRLEP